ncbi:alpha/beta hydrolase [Caminibacter profundus]
MNIFLYFLLFLVFIYIFAALYLYLTQDKKVFNGKWAKEYSPKLIKKIYFKTKDGTILEGGFTKNGENLPLVLYFSGNANNVLEFLDKIATNLKDYNFIGFNYPGFAKSEGKASEECVLQYATEIYDKYHPDIVMGRSLGSAVASFVASKRDVKGVVLITPFDSIENIAKKKYPIFPISLLLKHKFKEADFISKTKAPVVVVALKDDDLIPSSSLENLLSHIKNLKDVIYFDEIPHGFIFDHPDIIKILHKALKEVSESSVF